MTNSKSKFYNTVIDSIKEFSDIKNLKDNDNVKISLAKKILSNRQLINNIIKLRRVQISRINKELSIIKAALMFNHLDITPGDKVVLSSSSGDVEYTVSHITSSREFHNKVFEGNVDDYDDIIKMFSEDSNIVLKDSEGNSVKMDYKTFKRRFKHGSDLDIQQS